MAEDRNGLGLAKGDIVRQLILLWTFFYLNRFIFGFTCVNIGNVLNHLCTEAYVFS